MYHQTRRGKLPVTNEEGFLYAQGRYPTKIKPEDLPSWFIRGIFQDETVYISAKGVKHLVFMPVYNLAKDDLLYISYDKPIVPDTSSPSGKRLNGYAHIIFGELVIDYLKGVARYSRLDIRPIMKQIAEKQEWMWEQKN